MTLYILMDGDTPEAITTNASEAVAHSEKQGDKWYEPLELYDHLVLDVVRDRPPEVAEDDEPQPSILTLTNAGQWFEMWQCEVFNAWGLVYTAWAKLPEGGV